MKASHLLVDYTRYNLWANSLVANWLGSKPTALLTRETNSSFPSLRDTLLHNWGAEDIWLRRLKGETPVHFIADTFKGTSTELFARLLSTSQDFLDFASSAEEAFFQQRIQYKNSRGEAFDTPNVEVILHCMQHSTYHRGQLVTMGRCLGLTDPPHLDYILYVRTKG